MKHEIAIIIDFKASGGNLNGLENLVTELRNNYSVVSLKPNGGPQSGGLFDFVIDVVFNTSSEEFFKNIVQQIEFELILLGSKNYIFKPLVDALGKFETTNPTADFHRFSLQFDDIKIHFHSLPYSFHSRVIKVFSDLLSKRQYYNDEKYGQLDEITIPLQLLGNEFSVSWDCDSFHYSNYWGLSFSLGHERLVFDNRQNVIIKKDWAIH